MRETDSAYSQPDFDTLSEALHTEARTTTDLAFGPGQHYEVASGHAVLEIFPERHITRITTPTSRLELFASPAPQVIDGQVVLSREHSHEDTTLSVSPEGTVVFSYVSTAPAASNAAPATPDRTSPVPVTSDINVAPVKSVVAPEQPATAPQRPQEPPAAAPASTAGLAAANTTPDAPLRPLATRPDPDPARTSHSPETISRRPDQPKQEQQPRVQLTGRLGRDPNFRTSPRGTLVGRFPLAVHRDDGSTTWHTILAFGDRAKQLQHRAEAGELTKGQEVSLVGYQHTREQPTRDGHAKTVTEIYAVAVTKR